jgi:protein TonB
VPWGDPNGSPGGGNGAGGTGGAGDPGPDDEPLHLTGEVRPPQRLTFVKPDYPEIARRARATGKVILQIVVGRSGEIEQVSVLRSEPLFDEAAIAAVRRWNYLPAMQGGRPVKVYLTVIVEFGLS